MLWSCHNCNNSIRHIENRISPYFFWFFKTQFGLWRAAAFVSSPIHLLWLRFLPYCVVYPRMSQAGIQTKILMVARGPSPRHTVCSGSEIVAWKGQKSMTSHTLSVNAYWPGNHTDLHEHYIAWNLEIRGCANDNMGLCWVYLWSAAWLLKTR